MRFWGLYFLALCLLAWAIAILVGVELWHVVKELDRVLP